MRFMPRTKKSVAIKKRGWYGNPKGHAMAGRKGGQTTAKEYGSEFYRRIGRIGGRKSPGNFKYNPKRAREAGRKGGQSKSNVIKRKSRR